jgi:hypothetical protein
VIPRFVVIRPVDNEIDQRLVLHVDADGVARIDHERVLPERVLVYDAQRVYHLGGLEIVAAEIEWLIEHLPGALAAMRSA